MSNETISYLGLESKMLAFNITFNKFLPRSWEQDVSMLENEDQVIEHCFLVEPRRAAEVAQESAAGNNHLVGRRILIKILKYLSQSWNAS